MISLLNKSKLLSVSLIITLPFAYKIFSILSYSNRSAKMTILFCVVASPLFFLKVFPLSNISTSVTLKLNGS